MQNRRRHGTRVAAYFMAEMVVVAGSFFAGWYLRAKTDAWWSIPIEPLRAYLWLLPMSLGIWGAILWILNTYEGFRSRSVFLHAFNAAVTSVLGLIALFA